MPNINYLTREEANNYILSDFKLHNFKNIEAKLANIIAEKIRYFFFERLNEQDQVIGQVKSYIKKYLLSLPINDEDSLLDNKENLDKIVNETFDKLTNLGEIVNLHGVYWSPGQTRIIDLEEKYFLILSPVPTKKLEIFFKCQLSQFAHIRFIHKSDLDNIPNEDKFIMHYTNWLGLQNFNLDNICNTIKKKLSLKLYPIDDPDHEFKIYALQSKKNLRFQNIRSVKKIALRDYYILKDDINLYYFTNNLSDSLYPQTLSLIEDFSDRGHLITTENVYNQIKVKSVINNNSNIVMIETPCLLPLSIYNFFSTGYSLMNNKYQFYFDIVFINFLKKLFSHINMEIDYER